MRLIDADALQYAIEKRMDNIADEDFNEGMSEAIVEIRDAPTVEAIPIEWIENYLRNYRYMAPIEKLFVREMIKAWAERKEE